MDTIKETPCTRLSAITPFKFLHLTHQLGLPGPDIWQRLSLEVVRYDAGVCVCSVVCVRVLCVVCEGAGGGVTFQNKAILAAVIYQFLPPRWVFTLFVL